MYRLLPEITPPTETLFPGSWVEFSLQVKNMGNTQDAITVGEATIRSCPHLSVVGLEELENTVVPVTESNGNNAVGFTLRLEATSSHQERTCEVSISVESEGDNNLRSSTMDVAVKAPQVDTDAPTDDEDEGETSSRNETLPWFGAPDTIGTLFLAYLLANRRRLVSA